MALVYRQERLPQGFSFVIGHRYHILRTLLLSENRSLN
jgi:hypothetical protein